VAPAKPLSTARLAAFAAPCVPIAALGVPITLYVPQFYAGPMGLGLGTVGAIFMLARLWDGISDPLMGWISDRFPSRWGRRRHWVAIATPIVCLAAWFLFLPQAPVSPGYLLGWLFVLYLGWTMLTIPHMSWGAELSGEYHQRSRIHAFREAGEIIGVPLLLAAPALIEQFGGQDLEAHRVAAMGLFVIVLLPVAVAVNLRFVQEVAAPPQPKLPLRQAITALVGNRPLRTLVLADAISGASGAAVGALFLYVATEVWGLGHAASLLMLVYFFAGLGFVPLVVRASYRFGKHRTLIGCCAFYVVTPPLSLLVPHGNFAAAAGLMVLLGVNVGGAGVLFRSIMADVADVDELATGQKRTGLLYAFMALTRKGSSAVAVGLTFWALQFVAFQPSGQNEPAAVGGLAMLFAALPMICNAAVIALMWRFPIGPAKQAEVREALERQKARLVLTEGGPAAPSPPRRRVPLRP
jgi:glycoside/pentoside/hexuronide:cation symporter, GPH family